MKVTIDGKTYEADKELVQMMLIFADESEKYYREIGHSFSAYKRNQAAHEIASALADAER